MAENFDVFTLGQKFGTALARMFTPNPGIVVVHRIAGRRRYNCQVLQGKPEICVEIQKMLQNYPGMDTAVVSPLTGTILVCYHCPEKQISEVIDALSHLISGTHAIHDKSIIPSIALSAGENLNDSAIRLRELTSRFLNREAPLFLSRIAGFALVCYGISRVVGRGERPSGTQLFWWGLALLLRQSHRHPKEMIASARQAMKEEQQTKTSAV